MTRLEWDELTPSKKGNISQAKIVAALLEIGLTVYVPVGDGSRCDLIVELPDGRLKRMQCKSGVERPGVVIFPRYSSGARCADGKVKNHRTYAGAVELFGVYCPTLDKVWIVPMDGTVLLPSLRLSAPKRGGNQKTIRWAKDFEVSEFMRLSSSDQDTALSSQRSGV